MNQARELPPCLDAHAHLQTSEFDCDRADTIARARAAGVETIVCASDDEASSNAAVELAEREPGIWATVGVHPHHAAATDEGTFVRIGAIAASRRVVAIGEIGLDYYRDLSPRDEQRRVFSRQLDLADRLGMPVVIHSRDAAEDTYAMLGDWRGGAASASSHRRGLIHCFGYDVAWAERLLDLGFMISIPGTVTFPKAEAVRQVAMAVPEDAITVETDCPYLAPQPWRGKRNEPAYLLETIARVAALRNVSPAHLARLTANNAERLFMTAPDGDDAHA